jgi:DHA1 family bicyclomycin/chloramphenicol resistance-like MFS transporter
MIYAVIIAVVIIVLLPESLPVKQSLHPLKIGRNYAQLFLDRRYLVTTTASSLLYAGMIAFLSGSSFVFVDMMNVPVEYFGFLFLPTVIGYITGNALSTRLSRRRSSEQVMWLGINLGVFAALTMCLVSEWYFHPVSIILPMSLYSTALGLVLPHAMATALKPYPHMAGTASAMLGFLQMGISSLGGALVGVLLVDSALPMTLVILSAASLAWLLLRTLQRHS